MQTNPDFEAVAARREWVFPLLTLDVVYPFYESMGLRPGDPASFQAALRTAMVAERKSLAQVAAGGPPPPAGAFVRSVETAIGPAAIKRLVWWLLKVFPGEPGENVGLSDWEHVLRHCRFEPDRWQRLGFPQERSGEALERFREAINVQKVQQLRDEIQGRPLSDWDLHMYAAQLYDFDDDPQGPMLNPFLSVVPTVRDFQGYEFWAWVLRTLRPEQLTHLWECAKRVVQEEELTSVTELPDPSTLGIGL